MHRGGLAEAMETMQVIEPTIDGIGGYLVLQGWPFFFHNGVARIDVQPYGYDVRIDWFTHIVLVNGSPAAFTDSQVLAKRISGESAASDWELTKQRYAAIDLGELKWPMPYP